MLIGWGREGAKDVAYAREEFPFDKGRDCLDAQGAINEDVLSAIKDWLRENPNAQFLCIGCHGDEKGLYPVHTWSSSFAAMTWSGEGDDDQQDDGGYSV